MATRLLMPSKWDKVIVAGSWLSEHMPNPPLPLPQRYDIYNDLDGSIGIEFADEQDAVLFSLACLG